MTKYLVIINPSAGKWQAEKSIPSIKQILNEAKLDFDLVKTESAEHVYELAYNAGANGYDVVVAGGGDGTANKVVNALMTAKKDGKAVAKMGVIPLGRGNDFAASMGIKPGLNESINSILVGKTRHIDVGQVIGGAYPEGMYFGNGVGIGFDTIVGFEAAKLPAFLNGAPAYVLGALSTLFFHYERPLLKIELDDQTIEQACAMVTTMNGVRLGGTFMIAPESKPDDGLFSILIVEQSSRIQLLKLLVKVMGGTHAGHPLVKMPLSSKVKISALKGTLACHADGETICEKGEQITLINHHNQIELITEA